MREAGSLNSFCGAGSFDYVLRDTDRLDGPIAFGCGGVEKVRIRRIFLRNEP